MMVKDHGQVNQDLSDLDQKNNLTPQASKTSDKITDGGKSTLTDLQNRNGADFDKAYAQDQVDAHQKVLDALDHTLIPSAKNDDLHAFLAKVRSSVVMHLASGAAAGHEPGSMKPRDPDSL